MTIEKTNTKSVARVRLGGSNNKQRSICLVKKA
jgi:hypothetical protein